MAGVPAADRQALAAVPQAAPAAGGILVDQPRVPGPAGGHRLAAGAGRGQSRADERHPSQPFSARVTGSPGRWLQATKELVASR
jgi:hypothetical protein